jgi:hypothetical protein
MDSSSQSRAFFSLQYISGMLALEIIVVKSQENFRNQRVLTYPLPHEPLATLWDPPYPSLREKLGKDEGKFSCGT